MTGTGIYSLREDRCAQVQFLYMNAVAIRVWK